MPVDVKGLGIVGEGGEKNVVGLGHRAGDRMAVEFADLKVFVAKSGHVLPSWRMV